MQLSLKNKYKKGAGVVVVKKVLLNLTFIVRKQAASCHICSLLVSLRKLKSHYFQSWFLMLLTVYVKTILTFF